MTSLEESASAAMTNTAMHITEEKSNNQIAELQKRTDESIPLHATETDGPTKYSGSLRLRETKSNLHLNTSMAAGGNDNNKTIDDTNTTTASNNNHNPITTKREIAPTLNTHETTAGGPFERRTFSTRRSFLRNSQHSQYNTDIGLTRSQSLRRHYKRPFKTDPQQEECHNDEQIHGDTQLKTKVNSSNGGAHKTRNDITMMSEKCTSKATSNGHPDGGHETAHLNNAAIEATTTTATAATGAVRPTTLQTPASGIPTKSGHSPKSPRTPTTPLGGAPKQTQHSHHSHHSCGKSVLASVPETKLSPKTPPVTPDSPCTYLDDDLDSMYSFATTTSGRSTMSCEHPYVARNGTTFSGRKMKYVVHCSNYAGQGSDYLTPTQRAQRQLKRLKELLYAARQDLEDKDSEIIRLTREVVELRLFKASLSSPEERSASSDAVTVREAELKTSQDVSPIDMVDDVTKSSPRHIPGHNNLMHHHHHHHHQHTASSEMQSSFADSGHFEDMTLSSVHSKDSYRPTQDIACGRDEGDDRSEDDGEHDDDVGGGAVGGRVEKRIAEQRQELISVYEKRIEELLRIQDTESSEMKRSHNDRIEALLQKLAECNTRYADIVPDYEHAKERIRELERQLEDLQRKLGEYEEKQNKMYLHMYQQGQEAERIARADQALELAHRASNKVSLNELLQQLQSTQDELENIRAAECRNLRGSNHALLTAKEAISLWVLGARKTIYRRLLEAQKNRTHVDPEVTLQFLKSAVYYFLTDKQNSEGHLQAIESILEFTEAEKKTICKARTSK